MTECMRPVEGGKVCAVKHCAHAVGKCTMHALNHTILKRGLGCRCFKDIIAFLQHHAECSGTNQFASKVCLYTTQAILVAKLCKELKNRINGGSLEARVNAQA